MSRIAMTMMICVGGLLLCATGVAQAGTYTFQPDPVDLGDLDHGMYYIWGIDLTGKLMDDEYIESASLSIKEINDWTVEPGDHLYIHLLDNPTVGTFSDDDSVSGDNNEFTGQGLWLVTYEDTNGSAFENFTHDILGAQLDTLNTYVNNPTTDKVFGFGFDPDCHYWNEGVTVTVKTVPEPSTALFAVIGAGLCLMGRRGKLVWGKSSA